MPMARLPHVPVPPTVAAEKERETVNLSLDDAIRVALANSEVVRVLTGSGATSSGSTIYDPAIANTQIDQARGRFDPNVGVQNDFDRIETPQGAFDPLDPTQAVIGGNRVDQYEFGMGASKTTATGGTASLNVLANPLRSSADGLPLNPQSPATVEMGYSQPLLQGGGITANLAPIQIARIDTERSFYQLKGSVEQLVNGVIQAYWSLVFARVDVWARQQQVDQGKWAFDFADAQFRRELGNAGDRAQAQASLASFRANLISAKANVLQREAALRNILGLPPSDGSQLVPVTRPSTDWLDVPWETVLDVASQYRPDLIELKLQIETDQQQLLLAQNEAAPRVDASALYRWNSLGGRDPNGDWIASGPGQFTGWQFGIDASLPLGLRQARAALRQRELTLMRDRANFEQAMHNATHLLADSYRTLAQAYEEYQAFTETRKASRTNLDAQSARWAVDLTIYLNVLQAITSWGDSLDSEAEALLRYNTQLANLQIQTGTILEEHGVHFVEGQYCSMGPWGRLADDRPYPRSDQPGSPQPRYPSGDEPSENSFDLDAPKIPSRRDLDRRGNPDNSSDTPTIQMPPAERILAPEPVWTPKR